MRSAPRVLDQPLQQARPLNVGHARHIAQRHGAQRELLHCTLARRARSCSGELRTTPLGGALNPAWVGVRE